MIGERRPKMAGPGIGVKLFKISRFH